MPDLDTKALLAAVKEWEDSNFDDLRQESMDDLWSQALRALVAWYEGPQEYAAIQEQTRAVLLAAQERLLGKEE
jgi:hypothetical protein